MLKVVILDVPYNISARVPCTSTIDIITTVYFNLHNNIHEINLAPDVMI